MEWSTHRKENHYEMALEPYKGYKEFPSAVKTSRTETH